MGTSDWIALAALVVSVGTAAATLWQRHRAQRRADVTAFLHWLPARAPIRIGDGSVSVGYHLVLWNRGPARARDVDVSVLFVADGSEEVLPLTDTTPDEFPLTLLESGARYPVPWALGQDGLARADERRFVLLLSWRDSRSRTLRIPIRRGNTGS